MLQGAGLRRRQVTRISIKGIIDVGTAVSEGKQHVCAPFGGKKLQRGSAAEIGCFSPHAPRFCVAVGVADVSVHLVHQGAFQDDAAERIGVATKSLFPVEW